LAQIHPSAYVNPAAEIADDVTIGPFCVIEAGVHIGAGCKLDAQVTIKTGTTLGERNVAAHGVVLGGDPQDRKYQGETTFLEIGHDNVFREFVTVNRATGEGLSTRVGSHNYLMAYCHLGHNVTVEDWVTIANSTGVSGHVTIESLATIGGMSGIHQFCRIGKVAMIGGMTRVSRDAPPFMITEGTNNEVHDINAVGLRRYGITPEGRMSLHKACKLIFRSQLGLRNAMEIVRREVPITEELEYLLAFEERRYEGRHGRGDQR
jgi:UDP-N-acetylglucosamine acyltransferase